jgi:hypothetical protein
MGALADVETDLAWARPSLYAQLLKDLYIEAAGKTLP